MKKENEMNNFAGKISEDRSNREQIDFSSLTAAEIEKIFHDLEIRSNELELRNEELLSERDIVEAAALKFNTFYESSAMGYYTLDPDSTISGLNASGAAMLGNERPALIKKKFSSFVSPETQQEFENFLGNIFKTGLRQICEVRLKIKNDITSFIHLEGISSEKDRKCHINAMDITDRKLAEETVYNLLNEKELILKEVHHRVKNNMYNIGALLNMQANAQSDPAAKSVLFDAAGRVQSMSVLYDKLYRSEHTSAVSLKDYFPDLIYEIVEIFPHKKMVKIKTQIDDIILDAKILSILGILVNEIITNTMKYAFEGRSDGLITVNAFRKSKSIVITIEDNGKGIPHGITFENSTGFGMQLVGMLTEQLNGTIIIERDGGTKFVLEFEE